MEINVNINNHQEGGKSIIFTNPLLSILKLIPKATCKKCDYTFNPIQTDKNDEEISSKYIKCANCSTKMRNYCFEIKEYYHLKFQLFLLIVTFILFCTFYLKVLYKLTFQALFFMTNYFLLDQLFIRFKHKFYLIPPLILFLLVLHYMRSYLYLCKFIFILFLCIVEILKVNKVIINSLNI